MSVIHTWLEQRTDTMLAAMRATREQIAYCVLRDARPDFMRRLLNEESRGAFLRRRARRTWRGRK